jgi:transposase InsO family protein
VVGYAISCNIDTTLALAALKSALENREPPVGCIFHTDSGAQYASETYRRALTEAGLRGSMSTAGNPYHNAQAESFMKTLKVEEITITRRCRMSRSVCRGSSSRSTTPSAYTPPLATDHPVILKAYWSSTWLSSDPVVQPAGFSRKVPENPVTRVRRMDVKSILTKGEHADAGSA